MRRRIRKWRDRAASGREAAAGSGGTAHSRYLIESLEPRKLLAVNPIGSEFLVNTFTTNIQGGAATAADGDGDFVTAWSSYTQDGSDFGVYAQRFNAGGAAQGGEFLVNTNTFQNQALPTVAMDADGDFVIAWHGNGDLGTPGLGIFAQRYNAAGERQGGEFRVNTFTDGEQRYPVVAMDADGDFVIAWHGIGQGDTSYGVFAQRFNAVGAAQGGEFRVNTLTDRGQYQAAVAMDADGDFVIAWTDELTAGIHAQRYGSAGNLQGGNFRVDTTNQNQKTSPTVAMDADGDFLVAWQSRGQDGIGIFAGYGVYARRFNGAGIGQGDEFLVNVTTDGNQGDPAVAMDANGDFAVVWVGPGDSYGNGLYQRRYNAAGVPQSGELTVTTTTDGHQAEPAIAMDAEGDYVVTWSGNGAQDASGVYAQRYDQSTDTAGPIVSDLTILGISVDPAVRQINASEPLALFSEALSTAGGTTGANSATNPANYRLLHGGVDFSSRITAAAHTFNATTRKYEVRLTFTPFLNDGDYVLSIRPNLRDPAGNLLDGDFDGTPGGGEWSRAFSYFPPIPIGDPFRLPTSSATRAAGVAVGMTPSGESVLAWASFLQDGSDYGIYARRYDAAGRQQGGEFPVNTFTAGRQLSPDVAMEANGDFVVAWDGNGSGDDKGIFARRFNASGTPLGDEFRVNSSTFGTERSVSVAMDADGDFVVAWETEHPETLADDAYAQRYDAAGAPQGGNFRIMRIETEVTDGQRRPDVAMAPDGRFVVAWDNNVFDGTSENVFARRFSAAGQAQGAGVLVHDRTSGSQENPALAIDAAGNFAVAWTENDQTVWARRFDAAGGARGGEIFVEDEAGSIVFLDDPQMTMDADGDFALAWVGVSENPQEEDDVYAARFSAAGVRIIGGFRVNTHVPEYQRSPAIAMDADGDFVVAWSGEGPDSPGSAYALRFAANPAPTTLGIPAVTVQQDEANTVLSLWDAFADANSADNALSFSLVGNTNPALFTSVVVSNVAGNLTLDYAPNQSGQSTLTVRATDSRGLFVDTSFTVTVLGDDQTPPAATAVFVGSTGWTSTAFNNFLASSGVGEAAFGFRVTAADQLNELPWTSLNKLSIRFSEHVNIQAGDLVVRGVKAPVYALAASNAFAYDANTFTATWTLGANLTNEKLVLDLDGDAGAGVADASGNLLDGEWTDPVGAAVSGDTFPSGNGTAGGDFRFRLHVLPGDVNRSGVVQGLDVTPIRNAQGSQPGGALYTIFKDVNGNGIVQGTDATQVRNRQGNTVPTGSVSFAMTSMAAAVTQPAGRTTTPTTPTTSITATLQVPQAAGLDPLIARKRLVDGLV